MKVINVAGARPNFPKIAPIMKAMKDKIDCLLVHTGQHYDINMSKAFFEQLQIPNPDINLEVGSGSHAVQTAEVMKKFEEVCLKEKPTHVLVVGDVNSTIGCSLVAKKMGIKVIHVEAGLRSFDDQMPEEINRVLTDSISDYLFVTEKSGLENLKNEGVSDSKVFLVGNVMIDTLIHNLPKISDLGKPYDEDYCVVTLHRPSNVDNEQVLSKLLGYISSLPVKVIFPMHPRTKKMAEKFGIDLSKITIVEPMPYHQFMQHVKNAKFVLTDSGGIQEETTYLGVPCITMRENTERPITVDIGTNVIVGSDVEKAQAAMEEIMNSSFKKGQIPEKWDGKAAERIVDVIFKGKHQKKVESDEK